MSRQASPCEAGFRGMERFLSEWSRRDFLRRSGGAVAWAAFMGGALELLEACTTGATSTSSGSAAKKGGHLVEGSITDIKAINPVLVSDQGTIVIVGLLYDSLLGSKTNGDLYPLLAGEMPKQSSDGTTYSFTLRDNVSWSDGSRITADDVKFTYDLMFDPAWKDVNSPHRADLTQYLQSITVVDPRTIVFKTRQTYAPFLPTHGQHGILPKAVWSRLAPKEINTSDLNFSPTVTSGAFKLTRYDKGQQLVMAANDKYWAGRPNLDQYVYKIVPDSVTLANQLKTGEIDFGRVDPSQLSNVQANADLSIATFPMASFIFYGYQLDPAKPASRMFSDKAVRQALLLALNRQAMADAIYFKQAVVATSSVPPVSWAYNKDAKPQYPFDKARAESMLDSAGWVKGSDGTRAKGGVKLTFTLLSYVGNKAVENLVTEMQQRWKEIGVDATLQLIPVTDLITQMTNRRSFDIFLISNAWGQDPDQSPLWSSRAAGPGGFNAMHYIDTEIDRILDEAVSTLDQKKRKELYFQMQDRLNEELPAPILLFNKGIYGINKRLQGVTGGDSGLGTYTQFLRPWMRTAFVTGDR